MHVWVQMCIMYIPALRWHFSWLFCTKDCHKTPEIQKYSRLLWDGIIISYIWRTDERALCHTHAYMQNFERRKILGIAPLKISSSTKTDAKYTATHPSCLCLYIIPCLLVEVAPCTRLHSITSSCSHATEAPRFVHVTLPLLKLPSCK